MVAATVSDRLFSPRRGHPDLRWTLGADTRGGLLTDSWDAHTPNLLIVGRSGSGKSTLVHSMLCQLMHNNDPDDLKLWLVEPKDQLHVYSDVAHVERFVDTREASPHQCLAEMLSGAVEEMTARHKTMATHPRLPQNITEAAALAQQDPEACRDLSFHRLIIVIEECADYFAEHVHLSPQDSQAHSDILRGMTRLAREARAAGIHLLLVTRHPTKENLPPGVKQQCRRIGLKAATRVASTLITDHPGLAKITQPGAGVYSTDDKTVPFRRLGMGQTERETIIARLPLRAR